MPPRFTPLASIALLAALVVALAPRAARADGACAQLAYTFQPDCYHGAGSEACKQTLEHMDFGPQIAVWIETADHTLVETLMVTNVTAARGIGNRPGIWNFRSGPKFPYGNRWMSLPIWAYARGKLYPTAVMQDERHDWMGFHEAHSSKEPYYCRPVTKNEIDVMTDTITCASPNFNSAKGKLDPTIKSYYPPRNDLTTFINQDCDEIGGLIAGDPGRGIPPCAASSPTYAALNDLDAVAAATPAYGRPYTRTWRIPTSLPAGDYALVVEISKEFDTNAAHAHMAFEDSAGGLSAYGIDGNFGQPSVVYRVPIRLGGSTPDVATVSQIAGYSSWPKGKPPGAPQVTVPLDGVLIPRDGTISATVPGSGEARLLQIDGPAGQGRVHVELQRCGSPAPTCEDGGCVDGGGDADGGAPVDICEPLPPSPRSVSDLQVTTMDATEATLEFINASAADGKNVERYDIRFRSGTTMTEAEFEGAVPAPLVHPEAPGTPSTITIPDLKPSVQYVVGIRAIDACDQRSALVVAGPFQTPVKKFTQLSGCFVATAAFGSPLEPQVEALRHARDRLRAGSPVFAAATDLYYRSGPAAAALVGQSEVARALARRVIGPFASLAEALDAASRPERSAASPRGVSAGGAGPSQGPELDHRR